MSASKNWLYGELLYDIRSPGRAMNLLQQRIKELAERHGSMRAAARVLQIDHAYLSRLSTGDKDAPDDALLRKLGLRRVVTYRDRSAP